MELEHANGIQLLAQLAQKLNPAPLGCTVIVRCAHHGRPPHRPGKRGDRIERFTRDSTGVWSAERWLTAEDRRRVRELPPDLPDDLTEVRPRDTEQWMDSMHPQTGETSEQTFVNGELQPNPTVALNRVMSQLPDPDAVQAVFLSGEHPSLYSRFDLRCRRCNLTVPANGDRLREWFEAMRNEGRFLDTPRVVLDLAEVAEYLGR